MRKLKKFYCRVFGHKWRYYAIEKHEIPYRACTRCGQLQRKMYTGLEYITTNCVEYQPKRGKELWDDALPRSINQLCPMI